MAFENQVRWVAEQANRLRLESLRLRNGGVDPAALDEAMSLLSDLGARDDAQPARAEGAHASAAHARLKANRRRNHRLDQLSILKKWVDEHASEPYPSPEEKAELAEQVGMEVKQIEHWFTNYRKRHWSKKASLGADGNDDEAGAFGCGD